MKKLKFLNTIKFIIIFSIVLNAFNSNAFENNLIINNDTLIESNNYIFPKNIIFFELKGVTNYYSLNYERSIFSKKTIIFHYV